MINKLIYIKSMRKSLLIAAALCLSASAMAQTFEKPLSVSEGNNLYNAEKAGDIYWVFKADQDYIATVGNLPRRRASTCSAPQGRNCQANQHQRYIHT